MSVYHFWLVLFVPFSYLYFVLKESSGHFISLFNFQGPFALIFHPAFRVASLYILPQHTLLVNTFFNLFLHFFHSFFNIFFLYCFVVLICVNRSKQNPIYNVYYLGQVLRNLVKTLFSVRDTITWVMPICLDTSVWVLLP